MERSTNQLETGQNGHWTDFALCKGMTDEFFGPPGERPQTRARREAVANAYCSLCPVAGVCKATARENHEHGFWGGETDEERAEAGFTPRSPSRRTVIAARDRAEEQAATCEEAAPRGEAVTRETAAAGDDFVIRSLETEKLRTRS